MKKLWFVLALLGTLTFAACGGGDQATEEETETVEETDADADAEAPESEENSEDSELIEDAWNIVS